VFVSTPGFRCKRVQHDLRRRLLLMHGADALLSRDKPTFAVVAAVLTRAQFVVGMDELQAFGSARSEPGPLLHP
jgi:hypothetical protein